MVQWYRTLEWRRGGGGKPLRPNISPSKVNVEKARAFHGVGSEIGERYLRGKRPLNITTASKGNKRREKGKVSRNLGSHIEEKNDVAPASSAGTREAQEGREVCIRPEQSRRMAASNRATDRPTTPAQVQESGSKSGGGA